MQSLALFQNSTENFWKVQIVWESAILCSLQVFEQLILKAAKCISVKYGGKTGISASKSSTCFDDNVRQEHDNGHLSKVDFIPATGNAVSQRQV